MNAAESRPILDRAALPVGPVRFHIQIRHGFHIVPRLDLSTTLAAVYTVTQPETGFAWRESIASGSLVFLTSEVHGGVGSHAAGVVMLSEFLPDGEFPPLERKRGVLSHEMIHATQYDLLANAWGDALEDAVARKIPGGLRVRRYVDFGLLVPVHAGLNLLIDPGDRPWEKEASALSSGY